MIGVSRDFDSPVEHIVFEATPAQAPYNITKPLHDSQKVIERRDDGSVVFSIDVIVNYELERDLLGFGEGITVLSPSSLVERLKERLKKSIENYKKM